MPEINPDAVLQFVDVTVRRGTKALIESVSWTVEEDERWAVLGPNGAGKSTLLNVAAAQLHPTAGQAYVFGERLGRSLARAFDLTFIALRIGWVQEGNNRPETLPDDWSRKLWLSNNDLVQLFAQCVDHRRDVVDPLPARATRGRTTPRGKSTVVPQGVPSRRSRPG